MHSKINGCHDPCIYHNNKIPNSDSDIIIMIIIICAIARPTTQSAKYSHSYNDDAVSTRNTRTYNTRITVYLQRYHRETTLPLLARTRFYVQDTQTLAGFSSNIRLIINT